MKYWFQMITWQIQIVTSLTVLMLGPNSFIKGKKVKLTIKSN